MGLIQRNKSVGEWPRIVPVGDQAVSIEFGDQIDITVNRCVYTCAELLETAEIGGVLELIPSYRSLLVQYDSSVVSYSDLLESLKALLREDGDSAQDQEPSNVRLLTIPVLYGGDDAMDLDHVAERVGMTANEVIEIHSAGTYIVYMLGFAPGFPYLGGMDPRIACPRLPTPRVRIPAGSVGIAESQTGVYPLAGPAGWRIIGRTPARLFEPAANPPVAIMPGSFVRFKPIDTAEALRIESQAANGMYRLPESIYEP